MELARLHLPDRRRDLGLDGLAVPGLVGGAERHADRLHGAVAVEVTGDRLVRENSAYDVFEGPSRVHEGRAEVSRLAVALQQVLVHAGNAGRSRRLANGRIVGRADDGGRSRRDQRLGRGSFLGGVEEARDVDHVLGGLRVYRFRAHLSPVDDVVVGGEWEPGDHADVPGLRCTCEHLASQIEGLVLVRLVHAVVRRGDCALVLFDADVRVGLGDRGQVVLVTAAVCEEQRVALADQALDDRPGL